MKLSKTLLALTAALGLSTAAHSAFIVNATEVGSDVLFEGSGTLNTTDLTLDGSAGFNDGIIPANGVLQLGSGPAVSIYTGITGPANFGFSSVFKAFNSESGDKLGISSDETRLYVPLGYTSGNSLTTTNQFNNQTVASLGMTPGQYVWTWGSGANTDSFTLNIVGAPSSIPTPLPLALLALGGLIGLGLRRKIRA